MKFKILAFVFFIFIIGCDSEDFLTDRISNYNSNYNKVYFEEFFKLEKTTERSVQSISIYGKYLFVTHHTGEVTEVYDLVGKKRVDSINLFPVNTLHCNTSDFSRIWYEKSDYFPLLYVIHRASSNKLNVFRVIEDDIGLKMSLIQTVSFDTVWMTATLDNDNNNLYISYGENNVCYIANMDIPSPYVGDIEIKKECFQNPFEAPRQFIGQDACIHDGLFFQLYGYSNQGELRIFDLTEKKCIRTFDLVKLGIKDEPEGIAFSPDDNCFFVLFDNLKLYKMFFD